MRKEIENIVLLEFGETENVDIDATVIAIEKKANDHGLDQIVDWRDEELLTMLVLDWLSMHEVIWK